MIEGINLAGHTGALGIQYGAHGLDWVELLMPYDERFVGISESGVLASGPVAALIDVTCGASVLARAGAAVEIATLDLRVDYLRPATVGKTLWARAECYRMARQVAFVRGVAHEGDADDPVANVSATFMLLDADTQ